MILGIHEILDFFRKTGNFIHCHTVYMRIRQNRSAFLESGIRFGGWHNIFLDHCRIERGARLEGGQKGRIEEGKERILPLVLFCGPLAEGSTWQKMF